MLLGEIAYLAVARFRLCSEFVDILLMVLDHVGDEFTVELDTWIIPRAGCRSLVPRRLA